MRRGAPRIPSYSRVPSPVPKLLGDRGLTSHIIVDPKQHAGRRDVDARSKECAAREDADTGHNEKKTKAGPNANPLILWKRAPIANDVSALRAGLGPMPGEFVIAAGATERPNSPPPAGNHAGVDESKRAEHHRDNPDAVYQHGRATCLDCVSQSAISRKA